MIARRVLVIDPVLSYSTYLGGSGDEACSVHHRSCDSTFRMPGGCGRRFSNIYLAGSTTSTNFPLTPQPATDPPPAAFQSLPAAPPDVFVTKLNSAGNAIVFSTYLGGDGADTSAGVAVDSAFNVVVTGTTTSSNFPGQHFGLSRHSSQCERARIREQAGCDGQRSALFDLSFRQWRRNCSRSCGRPQKQDLRDWRHHF